MTKTEKTIWAAGFMDGEAYVGITRGRHQARSMSHWYYRVTLSVGQVHREPLDRLKELFGGSMSQSKDKYGKHWQWRIYGKNAVIAIEAVQPYLLAKRAQADLVLEFWKVRGTVNRSDSGMFGQMDRDTHQLRESIHSCVMALNRRRERLSEEAPVETQDDAIVRSHGNSNHESVAEMATPDVIN